MRFCSRITYKRKHTGTPVAHVGAAVVKTTVAAAPKTDSVPRLRERYPFLNDPSCPVELQALVTRRITRYYEYSGLYQQLRDCDDLNQCGDVAGRLLDAYLDNRAITRELDYYQNHKKVLGKHPFFRHYQLLERLRSMSTRDLIKEEKKTKDNIWRVKSEMKKGDKPHLDEKRRLKLQEYEMKLQEINRLLGE